MLAILEENKNAAIPARKSKWTDLGKDKVDGSRRYRLIAFVLSKRGRRGYEKDGEASEDRKRERGEGTERWRELHQKKKKETKK